MTPATAADERGADRRLRLADMPWRAVPPAAAALFLGFAALVGLRYIAVPIGYLVIAVAIAEALAPVVGALQRRRVPRGVAIGLVFLAVAAALAGLAALVVPPLVEQGVALVAHAPELVVRAQRLLRQGHDALGQQFLGQQLDAALVAVTRAVGAFLLTLPLRLFAALVDGILIAFLAIYWLVGAPQLERFALSLLPAGRRSTATDVLGEMGQAMGGYVRGTAINSALMGAMAAGGLWAVGVRYPIVLGVITMALEPLPVIGPVLAAVPVVLVALLESPNKALVALGLYVVLHQIESQVLTPNIMRRQTDIPQTLVIFAILAGGAVGGLLGLVVSIPLVAALRVFVLRVVVPVVRRWTGAGAGAPAPA